MVASKCYQAPPPIDPAIESAVNNALMQADAVRMIGIRKKAGEPLVSVWQKEFSELVLRDCFGRSSTLRITRHRINVCVWLSYRESHSG